MAPPNTLRIPEVANLHVNALFMEIMEFFDEKLGVINFQNPDGLGGDFEHRPRIGQISSGFERADIKGTLTTGATATTTTNTNEIMVALHRTLFHEYFPVTMDIAGLAAEQYGMELARQMAVKAAQRVLVDIYNANIGAATSLVGDHVHDVYVDTPTAGSQVDLTPTEVQSAKFLLADHQENIDIAVVNSKQWNDMRQDMITNDDFRVPNIVGDLIRGDLFRIVLGVLHMMDDQMPTAAGPTTVSPTRQQALYFRSRFKSPDGMAPVDIRWMRPLVIHQQHVLGGQSRREQLQAEVGFKLGIRGKGWDETNGGANPTDANLALSTNWDDALDDERQHGVILAITN